MKSTRHATAGSKDRGSHMGRNEGGLWKHRTGLAHSQPENGPRSYNQEKQNSANNLGEFGRDISPEPPDRSPADALSLGL